MNWKTLLTGLAASILMGAAAPVWAGGPHGPQGHGRDVVGAVYTMTNAADGNRVVMFERDAKGMLTLAGSVKTGGAGSGGGLDPLASQGSLVLSDNGRWLLAVNAGSNDITVFRVWPDTLERVDKVSSGGTMPVSLTVSDNLVYVLNAGGEPNITGFSLSHRGELRPLHHSTRSLGTGAFAQVGFDPQGEALVVTDKADNEILVFTVDRRGLPAATPVTSASSGQTPFGFIFDRREHLLVVEAASNAVSSYDILDDGTLQTISASVPNGQKAACWIAGDRRYVFTANPGTNSVSAYSRASDGSVTLLAGVAGTGTTPLDLATSENGRFLYAVDPSAGAIDMFRVGADGSLVNLGAAAGGLATYAQGLAAR
jgi:6-phosphogluconolactonase (cycloisomerase 2 family)